MLRAALRPACPAKLLPKALVLFLGTNKPSSSQPRLSACIYGRTQSFHSSVSAAGNAGKSGSTVRTVRLAIETSKRDTDPKKYVVLVESPAKAKTIENYLGADYLVLASYGHVRGLAARLGSVRPDDDFAMVWEVPEGAETHLVKIRDAVKGAKCLVLASDPDREGEAIAWHVSELLKMEGILKMHKTKVVRVAFNEITERAVLQAMQAPRDICMPLVNSYLARTALDYLIGFSLSPILWRKLPGSRSAGRVQSAALRLMCERESEIEQHKPQEYWTIKAFGHVVKKMKAGNSFAMHPTHVNGKKMEQLTSSEKANQVAEKLKLSKITVASVKKGRVRKQPPQPLITSTLQQQAQVKLGFGVMKTMTLAQKLYEGVRLGSGEITGLITYMRTDGLLLSDNAVKDIRSLVAARYGDDYVPQEPRSFQSKVMNAQEAHEAIRPTDVKRLPLDLRDVLEADALSLYSLIWRHTVACQMEEAMYNEVVVDLLTNDHSMQLRATCSNVAFPGFLSAIQDKDAVILDKGSADDLKDDEDKLEDPEDRILLLTEGDLISVERVESSQHLTRPPPRYSEGSLVKAMEVCGIGRPSTYASTIKTLELRKYVRHEHSQLVPEVRGRMVTGFLAHYFPSFIDYNFTNQMEAQFDEVARGQIEWKDVLGSFWKDFHPLIMSVLKIPMHDVIDMLQNTIMSQIFKELGNGYSCPSCTIGKLSLKLSRYGSGYFFACNSYPECRFKTQVLEVEHPSLSEKYENVQGILDKQKVFSLGVDPLTGLEVSIKGGPFGNYVQLGADGKGRSCFKLPWRTDPAKVTLDQAIQFTKYPVILAKHPEDSDPVWLCVGKYSFYVRHRQKFAEVPKGQNVDEMNLEKALILLEHASEHRSFKSRTKAAKPTSGQVKKTSKQTEETVKKQNEGVRAKKEVKRLKAGVEEEMVDSIKTIQIKKRVKLKKDAVAKPKVVAESIEGQSREACPQTKWVKQSVEAVKESTMKSKRGKRVTSAKSFEGESTETPANIYVESDESFLKQSSSSQKGEESQETTSTKTRRNKDEGEGEPVVKTKKAMEKQSKVNATRKSMGKKMVVPKNKLEEDGGMKKRKTSPKKKKVSEDAYVVAC